MNIGKMVSILCCMVYCFNLKSQTIRLLKGNNIDTLYIDADSVLHWITTNEKNDAPEFRIYQRAGKIEYSYKYIKSKGPGKNGYSLKLEFGPGENKFAMHQLDWKEFPDDQSSFNLITDSIILPKATYVLENDVVKFNRKTFYRLWVPDPDPTCMCTAVYTGFTKEVKIDFLPIGIGYEMQYDGGNGRINILRK